MDDILQVTLGQHVYGHYHAYIDGIDRSLCVHNLITLININASKVFCSPESVPDWNVC